MTTTKAAAAVKKTTEKPDETPVNEGVQAVEKVVPAEVVKVPVFRDKVFTSRVLVVSDTQTYQVARGQIEAADAELLAFLQANAEFELIEG